MENGMWHIEGIPDEAVWAGMERDMGFLNELNVYRWTQVSDLPPGTEIFDTDWVFKVKGGTVRARLVLRQIARRGGKRTDTYSPTLVPTSVRVLLAYSALMRMTTEDWEVRIADMSVAFMHADTTDDLYAWLPPG